jgi:hypothetical protein
MLEPGSRNALILAFKFLHLRWLKPTAQFWWSSHREECALPLILWLAVLQPGIEVGDRMPLPNGRCFYIGDLFRNLKTFIDADANVKDVLRTQLVMPQRCRSLPAIHGPSPSSPMNADSNTGRQALVHIQGICGTGICKTLSPDSLRKSRTDWGAAMPGKLPLILPYKASHQYQ